MGCEEKQDLYLSTTNGTLESSFDDRAGNHGDHGVRQWLMQCNKDPSLSSQIAVFSHILTNK